MKMKFLHRKSGVNQIVAEFFGKIGSLRCSERGGSIKKNGYAQRLTQNCLLAKRNLIKLISSLVVKFLERICHQLSVPGKYRRGALAYDRC